jgi:hypothetical protein
MGRQYGPVHLSGQFGDMQYSIDEGQGKAKLVQTVSKERILTDPNYALTRQNMSEFKAAVFAAKALRMCFGPAAARFAERYLTGRLNKLMRSVISRGVGNAGERSFEVLPNLHLFQNLQLDRKEPFEGRFRERFVVTPDVDRHTATVDIADFDTEFGLLTPQGATHFRLFLSVGALSDLSYSVTDQVYEVVSPDVSQLNGIAASSYLPIGGMMGSSLQLVASLPGTPILPVTAGLVVCLGVEFYRKINGNYGRMASGNAMKLVGVY